MSGLAVRPISTTEAVVVSLRARILDGKIEAGLRHQTMVLSTPEGENRAWRLYRRLGFVDLARNHMFPGDHRPFGVLGATLPFAAQPVAARGSVGTRPAG